MDNTDDVTSDGLEHIEGLDAEQSKSYFLGFEN